MRVRARSRSRRPTPPGGGHGLRVRRKHAEDDDLGRVQRGGQSWTLYVRPADKVLASAFTGNATRYQNVAENSGKLVAAYDVYVSDFGAIKIVPERQRDAAAYPIDHDHVSFAELDGVNRSPLAKTGDAEKMMITWEYGPKMDKGCARSGRAI